MSKRLLLQTSAIVLSLNISSALAQDVTIIQPGAPGKASKALGADEAIKVADTSYSPDDVKFMQDMIPHHEQAVEMAALVEGRTNRQEILDVAGRITASQQDEMKFMVDWLEQRGEAQHGADMMMHAGHAMTGMATAEDMTKLAAAKGVDFDRLFLDLMIKHHNGAVKMVQHLHNQPGSAYDPVLYDFTNDVKSDQSAEVKRMNTLLASLSTDPRVGLAAGLHDAGQAISNLNLLASLPRPSGFFDPKNPSDLPPVKESKTASDDEQSTEGTQWGQRSPLLSFSNTDMAFSGDTLVMGSYHGFNVYKLQDGAPKHYSSIVCPGGQGDVSVVGDILIMSVEQTRGRVDCGLQGIAEDVSAERFRGLRIFDISDLSAPRQVGQVQTCRGSHTHSVVSSDDEKIVVYNSGTGGVRKGEELEGCVGNVAGDDRTALFRIDVIEIPLADPSQSRIVHSPAVFADEETGNIAGLWQGGDHGDDTQTTRQTNQCHDITVFPSAKIAAGACSGNGIIFDISNPMDPKRIDEVTDKGFAYWHSATFNNDGTKVLFTDEWGGGSRPRCRAYDPQDWGADAIYNIVDGKLEFQSYFKLPAPQTETENCVAHNGSVVPVPGRDIFVQAWYQGGLSIIDFTDSSNPFEIAYFDRGPVHEEAEVLGGYWSTYWYGGKIYGSEIVRGLDVFELMPSDYLSENEIAAAALANQGQTVNPQQQFPVTWPAEPVVAMAYVDQLERSKGLSSDRIAELRTALASAENSLSQNSKNRKLAKSLKSMAKTIDHGSLAQVLKDIAKRL